MLLATIRVGALALGICLATQAAFAAGAAGDLDGVWLTQSGDTRIRISPCGAAQCGNIIWTKGGGKDAHNPDASKRERSLNGVQMISGMIRGSDGSYSGQLYNYLDGKTYTGKMKQVSSTELQLKGCVLGGLICKSQTWTRVQ